jgi:hypothetical protein
LTVSGNCSSCGRANSGKIPSLAFFKTNDREIVEYDYGQRVRALHDDGRPTVKGLQLALDDIAKDNPKARTVNVQQLMDLSFVQ